MTTSTFQTSIGKKVVMAVTGLLLLGFVIGHLLGNLLIFLGPDALNAYALKLRSMGPLLWVARISLLAIVGLHITTAIQLTVQNRKARSIPYHHKANVQTTYAARTMAVSGIIVFAYIVYHLLHFTFRVTHPDISHLTDASGHHDVYAMVVLSFQQPVITAVYVIAMSLLCMHLYHGIKSMAQSIGVNNQNLEPTIKKIGRGLAVAIYVGYVSIPLAAVFGVLKVSGGAA